MGKRFEVIKNGTLFYVSDTLTLKSTGKGPFDSEAECQTKVDEMNAACTPAMTTDTETKHVLTEAEAVKLIRRAPAKSHFSIHAGVFLPIPAEPGRGFESSTYINLSRKDAQRVVSSLLRGLEERGARVRISVRSHTYSYESKPRFTYWIG